MPELSPQARRGLPYWGIIERAASEGLGTADLWADIHEAAEEMGLESPGVSAAGVAELYSRAVGIQNRSTRMDNSDPGERMDGRYITDAPWQRTQAERDGLSVWQVRYEHTVITGDGPQSEWRTSTFTGSLPDTIAGIREAIEQDAAQLAVKYDVSHVSLSSIQVLEV